MKKLFIIIAFLYLVTYTAKAQFLDSIQASIDRKGKFTFGFNSRNSFITNFDAPIFGFMVGVCFDRKFAIGGGWNVLESYKQISETIDGRIIPNANLNFGYIFYYVEYLFRVNKHWEIDIPLSIGLGSSSYTYTLNGITSTQNSRAVIPVEPSVEVDYYFWHNRLGLYVQTGYRFMLVNNNSLNQQFNSFTYSYGVLIFPFEIYKWIFPRTKLAHMLEDN